MPVVMTSQAFLGRECVLICYGTDKNSVHEFTVDMSCEGCSGAVNRVLAKLKGSGVDDFSVDLGNKRVFVTSTLPANTILEALMKTGKACTYVGVKA